MESKSRKTDRYKTKTCPTCNTTHKKRGLFCSRSCGNSRTFSQKERQSRSEKLTKHQNAPEQLDVRNHAAERIALVQKKNANPDDADLQAMTLDDVYIPPITLNLNIDQFVMDGDIWTDAD